MAVPLGWTARLPAGEPTAESAVLPIILMYLA